MTIGIGGNRVFVVMFGWDYNNAVEGPAYLKTKDFLERIFSAQSFFKYKIYLTTDRQHQVRQICFCSNNYDKNALMALCALSYNSQIFVTSVSGSTLLFFSQ